MTPEFEYGTLTHREEILQFAAILEQCFISPPRDEEFYIKRIGLENFRIIQQGEKIAGGLGILHLGQWWGGQRVPMAGIAAVGIAPEYRGDGVASALLQHTIKELYTQEVPISVLYPATQRLYRKAGYEQGGSYCLWEIPTQSIQLREQMLPLQPVAAINQEIFAHLYQQQARLSPGHLDRNQAIWQAIIEPDEKETLYTYLIGDKDQPQGYIIFNQERTQEGIILRVKDWVVLTSAAAKTFWSFLNHHRSQIDKVIWKSSAIAALTLLLPEQTANICKTKRWMLRVIDLVKALEVRGYPPGIQAELHLEVDDDLLDANNGKFILSVANGRGEVTLGGKGELRLDIRGLAPLYTNLFTPHQLQLTGKLDATETALLAATQIFTSVSPGMVDFF